MLGIGSAMKFHKSNVMTWETSSQHFRSNDSKRGEKPTIIVVADSSNPHLVAREMAVSCDVVETVEDVTLGGILRQAV